MKKLIKRFRDIDNENINFFVDRLEELENKKSIDIVFSGTLSNGKSTLLNALLGEKLLPMALGATTSSIMFIMNGDDKIISRDKEYELNYENLVRLNGENDTLNVYTKRVENRNIRLVDTPGINDILKEREDVTYNYVPSADAVVFVIDITKGLTAEEKEFFEKYILKTNKDKIFIVLNKIDLIEKSEEIDLDKLFNIKGLDEYRIYTLSAKKALIGKIKNKNKKIKKSGFLEFENDLKEYIYNLDKQKIINKRKKELLIDSKKLVDTYFENIIKSINKTSESIKEELEKSKSELNEFTSKKEELEKELEEIVSEAKNCIDNNINLLSRDVNELFGKTKHKEELVEIFNREFPKLVDRTLSNIKNCISKDITIDMEELDDLMITLLINIDDVLASLTSILTMLPLIGTKVKPFIPIVQEGVRRLADAFGGRMIEAKVLEQVNNILDDIKDSSYDILEEFKYSKLLEYENRELGTIKSKIKSLEKVLDIKSSSIEENKYKIEFYQKEWDKINKLIERELDNV